MKVLLLRCKFTNKKGKDKGISRIYFSPNGKKKNNRIRNQKGIVIYLHVGLLALPVPHHGKGA